MKFFIRAIRPEDADDLNIIRCQPEVAKWMLSTPAHRASSLENWIGNMRPNNYEFVAVTTLAGGMERVIGQAGLDVQTNPKMVHSAEFGICVHKDYQDQGIGSALIEAILDLADNWLGLVRVELRVFTENEKAIKLYEKYGFEKEGVLRSAVLKDGKYADEYIMSRIRTK